MAEIVLEATIRPVEEGTKSTHPDLKRPPAITIAKASFERIAGAFGTSVPLNVYVIVQRRDGAEGTGEKKEEEEEGGVENLHREMAVVGSNQTLNEGVVQMRRSFMEVVGFRPGDRVRIVPNRIPEQSAREVCLREVTGEGVLTERERLRWEKMAEAHIVARVKYVYPGASFEFKFGETRQYEILSVNGQTDNVAKVTPLTEVRLLNDPPGSDAPSRGQLIVTGLPGLDAQAAKLNEFFDRFRGGWDTQPTIFTCGIVIHGGPGTGKSFILDRIAKTNWGKAYTIESIYNLTTVKEVFKNARIQQPCLVLIEDLHELLQNPKISPVRAEAVHFLAKTLDELARESETRIPKVVVVATCRDYFALPERLRGEVRFSYNVALPIPDAEARFAMLRHMARQGTFAADDVLRHAAEGTYAFSPQDLTKLWRTAWDRNQLKKRASPGPKAQTTLQIGKDDMDHALSQVRPSSMSDINLKPPTIHWDDIGGQQRVKDELRRMISTIKHPSDLDLEPEKGILLYGPPGCAKTLAAQALATESAFNFFSVKGPELINMYVGETERALRNLFARAYENSPAVIFFDEIDTMGLSTSSSSSSSKAGGGSKSLLGALLTELDGFEKRTGVIVMGATNRPWNIEPALLRPGRFEHKLYVGPPSETERETIFRLYARRVLTDELDYRELARMSNGFTGADIKAVMSVACRVAKAKLADGARGKLDMESVKEAISGARPSVTEADVLGYVEWERTRGTNW